MAAKETSGTENTIAADISAASGNEKVALILTFLEKNQRIYPVKSIAFAEIALTLIANDVNTKAQLLGYKANAHTELSEFNLGKSLLLEALTMAKENNHKKQQMVIYYDLGSLAKMMNDYDQALDYLAKSMRIAEQLNDKSLIGHIFQLKAKMYNESNESSKAIEYSLLAFQQFKELNDKVSMVDALNASASTYRKLAVFDKALKYQLKALAIIETTGQIKRIATNYNNTAILYKDFKDYDSAISMHLKSLTLKQSIGYKKGMVFSHKNLGESYRLAGNTELSLKHLSKALLLAKEIKNLTLINDVYLYLGRLHRDLGQFELSKKYLTDAQSYFANTKQYARLAETYLALGRWFLKQNNNEVAIENIKKSLVFAKKVQKNLVTLQAYQTLSIAYENQSDYKNALLIEKEFQKQKSEIFDDQSHRFISTLRIEYGVEAKQREIEGLIQENKISELKAEQHKTKRNIYFLLALFVFCLIIFFNYRFNQKKKLQTKRISLEKIQAKEQDLIDLNAKLEEMVGQRTMSLTQANQSLENTLFELKSTQASLIEVEKMASLSKLVAGVAHEVNTPLGTITTAVSFLQEHLADFKVLVINNQVSRVGLDSFLEGMTQSSNLIEANTFRAAELIQEFKQVAVDERDDPAEQFELTLCLEHVMDSLLQKPLFSQVTYTISANEPVTISSYATYWFQILESLLSNSVAHGFEENKGEVQLTIDARFGRVNIAFCDNGCGIAEEEIANIFEPFSTSKRNQGHIGLGLHIIFNLVTQTLRGSMRYVKTNKQGACFIIELPIELPKQHDIGYPITSMKS